MSLMNYLAIRKARQHPSSDTEQPEQQSPSTLPKTKLRFPNPLSSLRIIADKENALILFYNAFLFAAFYDITAVIPSQFSRIYHFNDLQIGLCYIPFGVGSMSAALINGQLLDRNFARWCRKLGVPIKKGRNQNLKDFPIEKARLQLALPAAYFAACMVLVFGWVLDINGPLAALMVILFFASFSMSCAFNVTSTLLVDFYPQSPATATAANNLVRCLLGAGATGVVVPMIEGMGIGWTFTFLSLFLLATSPMLWLVYARGMGWREERRVREEAAKEKRDLKRSGKVEEALNAKREGGTPAEGGVVEQMAVVEEEKEKEKGRGNGSTSDDGQGALAHIAPLRHSKSWRGTG